MFSVLGQVWWEVWLVAILMTLVLIGTSIIVIKILEQMGLIK